MRLMNVPRNLFRNDPIVLFACKSVKFSKRSDEYREAVFDFLERLETSGLTLDDVVVPR